ncbi:MAG TPA: acyltransferase [Solirubrobacterales bacterium]|nr:acyltransferase [Solirubrobacterales bacterium]
MRAPPTLARFSAGDALRGLSALGVMSLHVAEFSLGSSVPITSDVFPALRATYGPIGLLALAGGLSLSIFFALSGYLISRPFAIAYVRGAARPRAGSYTRNRLLRIVPAFWCAVLATLAVFGLSGSSPLIVPLTLGFGQVFAPGSPFVTHIAQGWTLGAEVTFYALVPVVGLLSARSSTGTPAARGRRLLALCLAIVAGTVAWRSLNPSDTTWIEVFPGVAAAFAPGIALAAAEAAWPERLASPRSRRLAAPVALGGVALLLLAAFAPTQLTWWRWMAEAAGGGLVVAGALLREWSGASPWKLLRNPVTVWLGHRSYSIYVLHYGIVLWLAQRLAVSGHPWETLVRIALSALLVTLLLADVSWRCVERPFLRLKRRRPSLVAARPSRATR